MADKVVERDVRVTDVGFMDLPLSPDMYRYAYAGDNKRKEPMNLTAYLEELDPSSKYANDPNMRGTDAFERQLLAAGIRTKSDPRRGLYADKFERFWTSDKPGAETLAPEFIARKWREAAYGLLPGDEGKRFYASSDPVSDVMYPDFLASVARQKQIAPAIPLSTMLAITTPIDSGVYKAFYLTEDSDERTMRRVAEGTDVPTAVLTGGDHTISVKKYGRRLLGSYETFRRMRIDRFALHIALLAVQAEVDKVTTALDVLVNGDGNASTAATNSNLTALDAAAVAGTPTVKGYLAWRMLWTSPYNCNTVLALSEHILEMLLMNVGSGNVTFGQLQGLFGIGGVQPIGPQMGPVMIGWDTNAPAEKWVGFDNRFALEMVTEMGSSLTETDKIIGQQLNEIVMTESVGFCILDVNSHRTLTLNA